MTMRYEIEGEVALEDDSADPKCADLSLSEINKRGYRVIGGDKGDLHFQGYTLEDDRAVLYKPALVTAIEGLTPDEVREIAQEILMAAYESIGVECIEHS